MHFRRHLRSQYVAACRLGRGAGRVWPMICKARQRAPLASAGGSALPHENSRARRPLIVTIVAGLVSAGLGVAVTSTPAAATTSFMDTVDINYYSATFSLNSTSLDQWYYKFENSRTSIGCDGTASTIVNEGGARKVQGTFTGLQPATQYRVLTYTSDSTCADPDISEYLTTFTTAGMTFSPDPATVTEGSTAATGNRYTVALTAAPTADVTVTVTAPGTDISPDTNLTTTGDQDTLTFTSSNWSTAQTVQLYAEHDDDAADELVNVVHTPSSSDASYNHVANTYNAVVSLPTQIIDDDLGLFGEMVTATDATLRISHHSGAWYYKQTTPAGGVCSSQIQATSTATTTPITGLSPGTDYTYKAYSDSTCTTELTDDARDADFTTKKIVLSTPRVIVPEEGRAEYTVRLGVRPVSPVTVTISTTSTSDADISANVSTLTFTPSDWSTAQTVVLSAADDTDTAHGTAIVEHTADSTYTTEDPSVVEAIEGDNDTCADTNAVNGLDAGRLVDECNILLAAEVMLAGPAGAISPLNWDTSLAIASWTGVSIEYDRVTGIDLSDEDLRGAIPNTLGDLSALTALDLSRNTLQGPIPARLQRLTKLTKLNLSYNYLSRPLPAQIVSLTGLTELDVSNNRIDGSIPAGLGDLSALTRLDLSQNTFEGSIPANLGSLSKLTRLDLSYNELTGSIPAQIGNLTALNFLSASVNELTGAIPSTLGNLTGLTALDLRDNTLSGSIPAQLGNLTNLTQLWLFNNRLSGCVPPNLVSFVAANEINTQKRESPPGSGIYINSSLAACPGVAISKVALSVAEGSTATYTARLSTAPTTPVTVTVTVTGDDDISVDTDTTTAGNQNTLDFDASNWSAPQTVTIAAERDSDSLNGSATVTNTTTSLDNSYSNTSSTLIATEIDQTSGAKLTATGITATGATLTISGHTAVWYIKRTSPTTQDCSTPISEGTASVTLTGLVPGTPYKYEAFSDSYCALSLASASFTTSGIALSTTRIIVPEEGTAVYTVSLATAPSASVTVTVTRSGDTDITVDTDATEDGDQNTLTFTTANFSTAQTVTLAAADDIINTHGAATITHTGESSDALFGGTTSTLIATEGDNDVCQRNPAVGGVASGGLVDDCNTLLAAKAMLAGTASSLDDWSAGTAIADWTGITVASDRVSALSLTNQGLNGMIPNTLGNLSELASLRLNSTSVLPNENNLSGPIPMQLGGLSKLGHLLLEGNSLSGPIPSQLGDISTLATLTLDGNNLTGTIPESLGKLTNLVLLNLEREPPDRHHSV